MNRLTESLGTATPIATAVLLFAIGLVILIIIVLILRAVACWYFRINEIVELLSDIRRLLSKRQAAVKSGSEPPGQVEITEEMIEAKFGKPGETRTGS